MTSDRARASLSERVLLEHVSENDLLGVLKYLQIDVLTRERAALHLARCTICHRRLEQRLSDIKDGTLQSQSWDASGASFRFPAPLRVLVNKVGELLQVFGPPALEPAFAYGSLNKADEQAEKT